MSQSPPDCARLADILESQNASSYRVNAYRQAALSVEATQQPLEQVFREKDLAGITDLQAISRGICAAIVEMITSGHWAQLERLLGRLEPEQVFRTLPGIGPDLAKRIHDTLHVDTLEELEMAAHYVRLTEVPGIGLRRAEAIRSMLAARLAHRRYCRQNPDEVPDVAALLDVDAEYRRRAADHDLPGIAPKRFNPSGEPWLPVLHTRRDDWSFTGLFSNTAKAHALGKSADWV